MMEGRSTTPFLSSNTRPCIWPVRPMPRISSAPVLPLWRHCGIARHAVRHQSCGSCSAQPMCGELIAACSHVAELSTRPVWSSKTARVPPVPTSMPRSFIAMKSAAPPRVGWAQRNKMTEVGEDTTLRAGTKKARRIFVGSQFPNSPSSGSKSGLFQRRAAIANLKKLDEGRAGGSAYSPQQICETRIGPYRIKGRLHHEFNHIWVMFGVSSFKPAKGLLLVSKRAVDPSQVVRRDVAYFGFTSQVISNRSCFDVFAGSSVCLGQSS